jgi:hypothetical protein
MPPSLLVSMASKINGKVAEIAALFDSSNKAYCYNRKKILNFLKREVNKICIYRSHVSN